MLKYYEIFSKTNYFLIAETDETTEGMCRFLSMALAMIYNWLNINNDILSFLNLSSTNLSSFSFLMAKLI